MFTFKAFTNSLCFIKTHLLRGFGLLPVSSTVCLSHSSATENTLKEMKVQVICALEDNYMFIISDAKTKKCLAVDPVQPDKIFYTIREQDLTLVGILCTHHHWDHAGGNEGLLKLAGKINVYGADERIGGLTNKIKHGDMFQIGSLRIKCLFTPCHTTGHICYYVTGLNDEQPVVFTGDTLFIGGCGRFFEGTANDMYHALIEILAELPNETKVYCGHEYTVSNLKFARHIEPNNMIIKKKLEWAETQRLTNRPTIPSTIREEKDINPFMRVCQSVMQKICQKKDPIEIMAFLREEKNSFRS